MINDLPDQDEDYTFDFVNLPLSMIRSYPKVTYGMLTVTVALNSIGVIFIYILKCKKFYKDRSERLMTLKDMSDIKRRLRDRRSKVRNLTDSLRDSLRAKREMNPKPESSELEFQMRTMATGQEKPLSLEEKADERRREPPLKMYY